MQEPQAGDPARRTERPSETDPAASAPAGEDAMDHRFAADEEVADGGAAGADEARTPGMGA
jgi:hypothetical protein